MIRAKVQSKTVGRATKTLRDFGRRKCCGKDREAYLLSLIRELTELLIVVNRDREYYAMYHK